MSDLAYMVRERASTALCARLGDGGVDALLREMGAHLRAFDCLDSDSAEGAARAAAVEATWRKVAPFFAEEVARGVYVADECIYSRLKGALCAWAEHQRGVGRHLGERGAISCSWELS